MISEADDSGGSCHVLTDRLFAVETDCTRTEIYEIAVESAQGSSKRNVILKDVLIALESLQRLH